VRDSSVDAREVHAVEMDQASERIAQLLREPSFDENNSLPTAHQPSGPSLLSQQAPPHGRPTGAQRISADGSNDGFSPPSSGAGSSMALDPQSGGLEALDRITVKIADLGNGERPFPSLIDFPPCVLTMSVDASSDLGEPPLHGRYPNAAVSLPRGVVGRTMGSKCGYLECRLCCMLLQFGSFPWCRMC
jgi:hypothetical protein